MRKEMVITLHQPAEELRRLMNLKEYLPIRERLLAVLWAVEGKSALEIARTLHRSRRSVQIWVYRYRDQGLTGLENRPRSGRPSRLKRDRLAALETRIEAGPRPEDGSCRLAGREIQRILAQEFGTVYSLAGTYRLLHRMGYSCLKPRPRHRKTDPETQEAWKQAFPLFINTFNRNTPDDPLKHGSRTKVASVSKGP